jgi:hypothetical protein
MMMMQFTTYDPQKGKVVKVGEYNPLMRTFTKWVKDEHYMRIWDSYGIQQHVIETLARLKCKRIKIRTKEGDLVSKFKDWLGEDARIADWGHGKQVFLPVDKMKERV